MYIHHGFVSILLLVVVNFYAMDNDADKNNFVNAWLESAYFFYNNKHTSLLHKLPNDVHARILSYINPKSILDDWGSSSLCLHDVYTPYDVAHFCTSGDRIFCLSERPKVAGTYDIRGLNFDTGERSIWCEKGVGTWRCAMSICGEKLIVQSSDNSLWVMSIDGDGKDVKYLTNNKPSVPIVAWDCHSILPFCVIVKRDKDDANDYTFCVYNSDLAYIEGVYHIGRMFSGDIKWHPFFAQYAYQRFSGTQIVLNNIARGRYRCILNNVGKDLHFSIESEYIYTKTDNSLVRHHIDDDDNSKQSIYALNDAVRVTVCTVGYEKFLTQHKLQDKSEKDSYFLHSFDSVQPIIMTLFNNVDGQCRLPSVNDNRYITVKNIPEGGAKISVHIPYCQALIEHYCTFKAALLARELQEQEKGIGIDDVEWDDGDEWTYFRQEKYKPLIKETAQHYAFFKKLMLDQRIIDL